MIIEATAKRLWKSDEASIRIADICEDTGLSSSAIYQNFRSRLGLIDATYLAIYEEITEKSIELFGNRMATATKGHELADVLLGKFETPSWPGFQSAFRQMVLRCATAAMARKKMRSAFIQLQETYLQKLTKICEDLYERGVLGGILTAREFARLLEVHSYARAINDMSLTPESEESWERILTFITRATVSGI